MVVLLYCFYDKDMVKTGESEMNLLIISKTYYLKLKNFKKFKFEI